MIYLDSSALLKLIFEEPESAALEGWLAERAETPMVSSQLARIEVVRACRRLNADAIPPARRLLAEVDLIPLSSDVVEEAIEVDVRLRSLDAIHLASALWLTPDVSSFVAYDQRLCAAASAAGLESHSPGA